MHSRTPNRRTIALSLHHSASFFLKDIYVKCVQKWEFSDLFSLVAYSLFVCRLLCAVQLAVICSTFFPWRWGGSSTQAWMPTYVSKLLIPQMIWVWRATVEWYILQGKIEELGKKPVPVPLCSPQIPHGLIRVRTRSSAVRGQRLTTWAMARPAVLVTSYCYRVVSHKATHALRLFSDLLFISNWVQIILDPSTRAHWQLPAKTASSEPGRSLARSVR
jgi:hypothetical protein